VLSRCGGIFSDTFIANLLLNLAVKKRYRKNRSMVSEDVDKSQHGVFLTHTISVHIVRHGSIVQSTAIKITECVLTRSTAV